MNTKLLGDEITNLRRRNVHEVPRTERMDRYRGLGGGFGLGTPVVSYAPRFMFDSVDSLIIMEALWMLGGIDQWLSGERRIDRQQDWEYIYTMMKHTLLS